jgi:hypothetical protein
MKIVILAAFTVLSLGVGALNAQSAVYHAPAQNFHQNNWLEGGD